MATEPPLTLNINGSIKSRPVKYKKKIVTESQLWLGGKTINEAPGNYEENIETWCKYHTSKLLGYD